MSWLALELFYVVVSPRVLSTTATTPLTSPGTSSISRQYNHLNNRSTPTSSDTSSAPTAYSQTNGGYNDYGKMICIVYSCEPVFWIGGLSFECFWRIVNERNRKAFFLSFGNAIMYIVHQWLYNGCIQW